MIKRIQTLNGTEINWESIKSEGYKGKYRIETWLKMTWMIWTTNYNLFKNKILRSLSSNLKNCIIQRILRSYSLLRSLTASSVLILSLSTRRSWESLPASTSSTQTVSKSGLKVRLKRMSSDALSVIPSSKLSPCERPSLKTKWCKLHMPSMASIRIIR